jgi:hypothetical protein
MTILWRILVLSGIGFLLSCLGPQEPSPYDNPRPLLDTNTSNCPRYQRDEFGYPALDAEGCRDTRARILIAQSRGPISFRDARQCRVDSGLWIDPYSGDTLLAAADTEIDHLIPLKEAFLSGAQTWNLAEKIAFANHEDAMGAPLNALIPVRADLNRSKSDRDPSQWLPPRDTLGYALRWEAVKNHYNLTADSAEWKTLEKIIRKALGRIPTLRVQDPEDLCRSENE